MPVGERISGDIDVLTELCDSYSNEQLGIVLRPQHTKTAHINL